MEIINKNEKVYVGRESVCMGDDVNAPNMLLFTFTNDLEIFKNNICKCLPYIVGDRVYTWNGYKGCFKQKKLKKFFYKRYDDVCDVDVYDNKNSTKLFSITIDKNHNILDFQINDNWYEIIKEYPYLYLKRAEY